MADDTWQELRSKVEGLGAKLKVHLEQENDAADTSSQPGDTRAAFEEMTTKLQDALTGFSNAGKDPFIRDDMRDIGVLLKNALSETYQNVSATVGEDFGKAIGKTKGEVFGDVDPEDPPSSGPTRSD